MSVQVIIVNGRRWGVEFSGFSSPLRAVALADEGDDDEHDDEPRGTAARPELRLRPWTCADHLRTLREHLRSGSAGLELDSDRYADAVLDHATMTPATPSTAEMSAHDRDAGRPLDPEHRRALALWWANGLEPDRDPEAEAPDREGWLSLGEGSSVELRGLTWGERLAAQRAALVDTGEGLEFDPVAYLEAMLERCVVQMRPARDLDALDARATRILLSAVTELNHPSRDDDPLLGLPAHLAASALRLCASLGWTLERILGTPAAEVSRLLSLLDAVEGPASEHRGSSFGAQPRPRPVPRPSARPRMADHPDAVVLVFGEDEGAP